MNASQAQTMPDDDGDTVGLDVVLRGYDRRQVHALVEELRSRAAEERRRAELAASRQPGPPSFELLGANAAAVMERAGRSAKALVDEASRRGNQIIEEAGAEAMELIKKAEQRATELESAAGQTLSDATQRSDRILARAEEEAREVHRRAEEEARQTLRATREEAEELSQRATRERMAIEARCEQLRREVDRLQAYLAQVHAEVGALLEERRRDEPAESETGSGGLPTGEATSRSGPPSI
jgi:vacuolar-type H+-ATPase subunit H